MSKRLTINESLVFDGDRSTNVVEQTFDIAVKVGTDLVAAKTGTLTTRTSASVGTATLAASHGVTTGAKISMYWFQTNGLLAGARYGVTVGTVAVNSVPFTGGVGDDLPVATTALTVMVEAIEAITIVGDDVKALVITATKNQPFHVRFFDDAGTPVEIESWLVYDEIPTIRWYALSGEPNPFAGVTISQVRITHGDSTQTLAPSVNIGRN